MTERPPTPPASSVDRDVDRVVDLGNRLAAFGLPAVAGRILAALMLAPDPSTSAGDLAKQVGASRASISTMTRLLSTVGLVERVAVPRSRGLHYRLSPDAWSRAFESDRTRMQPMRHYLEVMLSDATSLSPHAERSVRDLHEYVVFWQQHMDDLRVAWDQRRTRTGEDVT